MFSSILNFLGLSKKVKQTKKENDELNRQIIKSIEDFKNRPIHKILTAEIIDKTRDEDLLQVVFDNLMDRYPKNYTEEYVTVLSWAKPQQAIYMIWLLEAEINNGGFNQYYCNPSGQFAKLTPELLKYVGANKFADLLTRANNVYETGYDEITKYQDGSLEGFSKSYKDNPLNKFDDEFYNLYKDENLQRLQVDFIRKNKPDFINK